MLAKPEPLKRTKARKVRAESKQAQAVRAACVARDGYCRFGPIQSDALYRMIGSCEGVSEFAHLEEHRRYRTRGMAPKERHSTEHAIMACTRHHRAYDAHHFDIQPASSRGADGPLGFACQGWTYVEREER